AGQSASELGGCSKAPGITALQCTAELSQYSLERQIARPTRHCVIAEINETARFEPAIDKPTHRALRHGADPGVDAVRGDVIELRQFEIDRRSKIDGVQMQVRDCRGRRQPAGMI